MPAATATVSLPWACVGTAPSRNDRDTHEARGRSGDRVDDVEAVQSHEDDHVKFKFIFHAE